MGLAPLLLGLSYFFKLDFLVIEHLALVVVERHEVEVQVLDSVLVQDVLGPDQLAQVQIIKQACLGQGEKLSIVQSAVVSVDAHQAHIQIASAVADVQSLLIGPQAVAQ